MPVHYDGVGMDQGIATEGWEDLAERLQERGGLPRRRAEVVALLATGRSHADVQDELGLSSRGQVSNHVARYREDDVPQAEWLAEHAPEV